MQVTLFKKPNVASTYITNAHSKMIYSLDWCYNDQILLSTSRDKKCKVFDLLFNGFFVFILKY